MQLSLVAFQRAQKVSAERQRTVVEDTKRAVDEELEAGSSTQQYQQQQQQQAQQLQMYVPRWGMVLSHLTLGASRQRLSPADLAFQESLIQERETEIREIETGIHELNEIFRDLGTLVVEQGDMIGVFCFHSCLLSRSKFELLS